LWTPFDNMVRGLMRTWKNYGGVLSSTSWFLIPMIACGTLGFLYIGSEGWRLAPAYDLNPLPVATKPRVLSTNITLEDGTASLGLAFEVADYFKLSAKRARTIAGEVGKVVGRWDKEASQLGISEKDWELMASAFEHDDLREAKQIR
jgi:serine/threonine-protein kinase HipA